MKAKAAAEAAAVEAVEADKRAEAPDKETEVVKRRSE
jgi:hypothetical protein